MSIVLALLLAAAPARAAADTAPPNPYHLQPGAEGERCLDCHGEDFRAVFAKASVHTPVRERNCAGCHRPHVASTPKFLDAEGGRMCAECHSVTPPNPASTHPPVAEARCLECHAPHASDHRYNLVRAQPALCFRCHPALGRAAAGPVRHPPVEKGCGTCHAVHGSARASKLLVDDVPELCLRCHPAGTLASAHGGYPVQRARCTSCHEPHGSAARGLLLSRIHPPVARRNCGQCHRPPGDPSPFRTRRAGAALCRGCHAQRIDRMLDRVRVHWPVASGACLACHSPHAGREPGLPKGGLVTVCGACHADTIRRQELSATPHPPVASGACPRCHDPHGGTEPLLFRKPDAVELCGACHDWRKHMDHPLRRPDPRNPNLTVQCLSCHRAHGSENQHLFPAPNLALCTGCHQDAPRRARAAGPSGQPPYGS